MWHRAEYIVDRYVFHAPVCIMCKLWYGPLGGYRFKDVLLSKTEGLREWTEQAPMKQEVKQMALDVPFWPRKPNQASVRPMTEQNRSDTVLEVPKERDIPRNADG